MSLHSRVDRLLPCRIPVSSSSSKSDLSLPLLEDLESRLLMTTYVVDSLSDKVSADGQLTLREAVRAASDNRSVNEAPAGEVEIDIIQFAPSLAGNDIPVNMTGLVIEGALEIHGSGMRVDTNNPSIDYIFTVGWDADVLMKDLQISGQHNAGGVRNFGMLQMDNCKVDTCYAGSGGGISNGLMGNLRVTGSSISYCDGCMGGGIFNEGVLYVADTLIRGCLAYRGGGIFSYQKIGDASYVVGSHVFQNGATDNGGGIWSADNLTIANSCICDNTADGEGGGVYGDRALTTVTNSMIAVNSAAIGGGLAGGGITLANSVLHYNHAGEWPDVNTEHLALYSHNFTSAVDGNPMIESFAEYRMGDFGYECLAALPGSPLIDAGANVFAVDAEGRTLQTDMEGNPRIYNDKVDIGPTEFVGSIISDRWLFYNNSLFDGFDSSANAADDSAIDLTKTALLPGAAPTPANYTGYASGLNGVMLNVAGLSADATLSEDDFDFHVGYLDDWTSWVTAPAPESITVRGHDGLDGARVSIVWADNAIENKWLRVRVKATWNTMLPKDDVFYFASVPGDANGDGNVDLADFGVLKGNFGKVTLAVDGGDFNLSGYVTLDDFVALKTNFGATLSAPPAAPVAMTNTLITAEPEDVHTDSEPARRTSRGVRSLVRGRTGSIARRRIAEQLGRPTNVFDLLAEANAPSLR